MPRIAKPKAVIFKYDELVVLLDPNHDYDNNLSNPRWGDSHGFITGIIYDIRTQDSDHNHDIIHIMWENGNRNTYRAFAIQKLSSINISRFKKIHKDDIERIKVMKKARKYVAVPSTGNRDRSGIGGTDLESILLEVYNQLTAEEKKKIPKIAWITYHETSVNNERCKLMRKRVGSKTICMYNWSYLNTIGPYDRVKVPSNIRLDKHVFNTRKSGSSWSDGYGYRTEQAMSYQLRSDVSVVIDPTGFVVALIRGKDIFISFDMQHHPVCHKKMFIDLALILLRRYIKPIKLSKKKVENMAINKIIDQMTLNLNKELVVKTKSIVSFKEKIKELEQAIGTYSARVAELKPRAATPKVMRKTFLDSIVSLKAKPIIMQAKLEGTSLRVVTDNITIKGCSWKCSDDRGRGPALEIKAGRYVIDIGLFDGNINVKNMALLNNDNVEYHHPHVTKNGAACLGNLTDPIRNMVKNGDIGGAAFTICGYLAQWNRDDAYISLDHFKKIHKQYTHIKRKDESKTKAEQNKKRRSN